MQVKHIITVSIIKYMVSTVDQQFTIELNSATDGASIDGISRITVSIASSNGQF